MRNHAIRYELSLHHICSRVSRENRSTAILTIARDHAMAVRGQRQHPLQGFCTSPKRRSRRGLLPAAHGGNRTPATSITGALQQIKVSTRYGRARPTQHAAQSHRQENSRMLTHFCSHALALTESSVIDKPRSRHESTRDF